MPRLVDRYERHDGHAHDQHRCASAPLLLGPRAGHRAALAGMVGRAPHLRDPEHRRTARRPRARRRARRETVRARHVPVPVGNRPARRPPTRIHRHRRVRPLQADDRPQRAACNGLRRVRAARPSSSRSRPANTRRSRPRRTSPPIGANCAVSASPTTRAAASPRPTPSSTGGRNGSSARSSTPGTTTTSIGHARSPSCRRVRVRRTADTGRRRLGRPVER